MKIRGLLIVFEVEWMLLIIPKTTLKLPLKPRIVRKRIDISNFHSSWIRMKRQNWSKIKKKKGIKFIEVKRAFKFENSFEGDTDQGIYQGEQSLFPDQDPKYHSDMFYNNKKIITIPDYSFLTSDKISLK